MAAIGRGGSSRTAFEGWCFSPHFDDAAGAAHMLCAQPDSLVVTVMGGGPSYPDPPSEWMRSAAFRRVTTWSKATQEDVAA